MNLGSGKISKFGGKFDKTPFLWIKGKIVFGRLRVTTFKDGLRYEKSKPFEQKLRSMNKWV